MSSCARCDRLSPISGDASQGMEMTKKCEITALRQRGIATRFAVALALAVACVMLVAGGAGSAGAPTLVLDNSFALDTSDPGRALDPTSSIIDRAVYETLF